MPDDGRDVIEVLTHDHREVEGMFGKLTAAAGPGCDVGHGHSFRRALR
jgi:hypothetical protein